VASVHTNDTKFDMCTNRPSEEIVKTAFVDPLPLTAFGRVEHRPGSVIVTISIAPPESTVYDPAGGMEHVPPEKLSVPAL
jgi:hypothetical protein